MLLLMTGAPLVLLGAPMIPMLRGIPRGARRKEASTINRSLLSLSLVISPPEEVAIALPTPTTVTGRIRELAGAATNRIFRIRVALSEPPAGVLAGFSARILIPRRKR